MNRRRLLACVAVSAVCLVGFFELAEEFANSPFVAAVDQQIQAATLSLRHPLLTALMRLLTVAGGTVFVSAATVMLVTGLWVRGRRADAIFAGVGVVGGVLLSTVAEGAFVRQRPSATSARASLPASYSLPSGHSMGSFCLAVVVGTLVLRSNTRPGAKAAACTMCMLISPAAGGD